MTTFLLKEILLLSKNEGRAKRVKFHPERTIVLGLNDTGKSSLLKSIYTTFGAVPNKVHPHWNTARVHSLVHFSLGDHDFSIYRNPKRWHAIFDGRGQLLHRFPKVTTDLGPYLARQFKFGLRLNDKQNMLVTPPPAFYFLPFYVDQDMSWTKSWSAFANLEQFSNWKQSLVEYHIGLRPNSYYEIKGEVDRIKDELKEDQAELRILQASRSRVVEEIQTSTFNYKLEDFQAEIARLVEACQSLNRLEEQYKQDLLEQYNVRATLDAQVQVAKSALKEIHADYDFATKEVLEEQVPCPTCGTIHENTFAERFSLAQDEDRCREILAELVGELDVVNRNIQALQEDYAANREQYVEVSKLLEEKTGEVQLRDVIEAESRQHLHSFFNKHIHERKNSISEKESRVDELTGQFRQIEDKDRRKEILSLYRGYMKRFTSALDLTSLPDTSWERPDCRISETGSDLPRALLAYYFSILHTMREWSSSVFSTIVIDSPNQQGLDNINIRKVIKFILENKPAGSQLILGLEDLFGLEADAQVIELRHKNELLRPEEFHDVNAAFSPYLDALTQFESE